MSELTSQLENLNSQLKKYECIKVPLYQRSYAWDENHVQDFWDDIKESIEEGRPNYFIGPIITKNTAANKVELIDGQQRITTTLALISIVRRLFYFEYKKTNDEAYLKYHQKLDGRLIVKDSLDDECEFERYIMNEENSKIFQDQIVKDTTKENLKKELVKHKNIDSNHKLLRAIQILWDEVDTYIQSKFDDTKLKEVVNYVLEKVQVLNINVNDESDAFLIFETINDRGRDLDTMDLVKSLMFSKVKNKDLDSVMNNWVKMTDRLRQTKLSREFLGQYWMSKNGHYARSNLFKLIKESITDKSKVMGLSNSLLDSSDAYTALSNSDDLFWEGHSVETTSNLSILKMLGAKAVNPVLLASLNKFTHDEFRKLTAYLVKVQIRCITISSFPTNKYSKAIALIPPQINDGTITKAKKILDKLIEEGVSVTDEEFKAKFLEFSSTNTKLVKYILSKIEESLSSSDKVVNNDGTIVNIEHVMPKNKSPHWPFTYTNVGKDAYSYVVNSLGNLALSNAALNSKAKSFDFDKKKAILFEKSKDFQTTFMINIDSKWDIDAIKKRQITLSKNICNIWNV